MATQTDLEDIEQMIRRGLVDPGRLLELFRAIEPELVRYPALDPTSFKAAVEATVARWSG